MNKGCRHTNRPAGSLTAEPNDCSCPGKKSTACAAKAGVVPSGRKTVIGGTTGAPSRRLIPPMTNAGRFSGSFAPGRRSSCVTPAETETTCSPASLSDPSSILR